VHDGNRLVVGMMDGDPTFLGRTTSHSPRDLFFFGPAAAATTTTTTTRRRMGGDKTEGRTGGGGFFGIYHGRGEWLLDLSPFSIHYYHPPILGSILRSMYLLYRYPFDLHRMRMAAGGAARSFDAIYAAVDDTNHDVAHFDNPMDAWDAVGLGGSARVNGDNPQRLQSGSESDERIRRTHVVRTRRRERIRREGWQSSPHGVGAAAGAVDVRQLDVRWTDAPASRATPSEHRHDGGGERAFYGTLRGR
jgi:hypothetical protein